MVSQMFGYIVVNQSEMKFKEYDVYRSYYCGLCQSLKERYGVLGQLSLNYDMTFILMLLTGLYEPEDVVGQCRCVARPFEKHQIRRNLFTDYVADMTVLFACYKAEDDWEDEHSLKGLAYSYLLGKKCRKKPLLYADKVRSISLAMQDFADAEKQGNADIDTMAGLFGKVMAQIVSCREDEWKDNLERLGFFLGKFIYLMDAYEDVEKDIGNNSYNPLKEAFLQKTPEQFATECRTLLTMMMAECSREFEQLPILLHADILRNILYSGVWCRYTMVTSKRYENQNKENNHE